MPHNYFNKKCIVHPTRTFYSAGYDEFKSALDDIIAAAYKGKAPAGSYYNLHKLYKSEPKLYNKPVPKNEVPV